MGAAYSHTSRADGTVIDGSIYNGDHQNHIDNAIPSLFDDYSANAAQMRSTVDPGEAGTESLPTSLAGELERLRFAIKEIKDNLNGAPVAQWYTTLLGDFSATAHATGTAATPGLLDIPIGGGVTIRVQWGNDTMNMTGGGAGTVSFKTFTYPQAFSATPYLFLVSGNSINSAANINTWASQPLDGATGNVRANVVQGTSGGGTANYNWIAIGKK